VWENPEDEKRHLLDEFLADRSRKDIRQRLARKCAALLKYQCERVCLHLREEGHEVSIEDIVPVGVEALVEGIESYNPGLHGQGFEVWLALCIRTEIFKRFPLKQ